MKVAVCGSESITSEDIAKKAFDIGRELAKNDILLLTGSGQGYPYESVKGAHSAHGKIVGISPAKDEDEHTIQYKFPKEGFTKIEFTGMGIPARNFPLVREADAVIIISGQTGTLNEFTIAFHENKPIGILKDSGGITDIIEGIAGVCNKNGEIKNIVYSSDPKELVKIIVSKLNQ
jgi:uncharacterized protein (TIGR00725 family)